MESNALTDQRVVDLYPLHIGPDEEGQHEVGRPETGVFIALPPEGVALIRWLQEGLTLSAVKERFAERFGETPDLDDFLVGLTECDFVREPNAVALEASATPPSASNPAPSGWLLFAGLPQERVAWLLSRPMRLLYYGVWVMVPVLFLLRPDLLPKAADVWLTPRVMVNALILLIINWGVIALHEMAHLLAVRARGCTGALSLSHRLQYLVANVDMSGIRTVPREKRYAPYLAGMTWDMSVLLLLLTLRIMGVTSPVVPAIAFLLSMGLLFQFALYMRTDIYYVFANWFRLGNLMSDTQHWLVNLASRVIGRPAPHDLRAIPDHELRVIRWYALVYLLGVGVTVGQFILIGLPLLIRFLGTSLQGLQQAPTTVAFWDGVLFVLMILLNYGLLFYVNWRERRERRRQQVAA